MEELGAGEKDLAEHARVHGQHFGYLLVELLEVVVIVAGPFKEVKVFLLADNSRAVSWRYASGIEMPYDASLSVEYSRAGGTWQTLAEGLPVCYCYIDKRITNRNKYNNDFYRIRLDGDAQTYYSQPQQAGISLSYPYSSQASNLVRLSQLQMSRTGRTGYLMKKIVFGQKCPVCKQFQDDAPVNEHCPCCLGTGINGGYYRAFPMNILETGQSRMQGVQQHGAVQTAVLQAKCTAWPLIELGDVWVDDNNNQRYYIQGADIASKYKHVPLIYNLKMHLLQLSDVLHSKRAQEVLQESFIDGKDWTKEFENT